MNVKFDLSSAVPGSCCSQPVLVMILLSPAATLSMKKQRGHVVLMALDENAAFRGICASFKANPLINKL